MSVSYCKGCSKEHDSWAWIYRDGWYCELHFKPSGATELVPEHIHDQRKEYFNSIVQPYRGNDLSKEYIDAHGTKGIKATEKEVRNAKNVWSDLEGFSTRNRSK